jgi:hypothetical protein
MRAKRFMQFFLVFAVLSGFTASSLGLVQNDAEIVKAVSAQGPEKSTKYAVSCHNPLFKWKVLHFLKKDSICMLSEEQAKKLAEIYPHTSKEYTHDDTTAIVLFLKGKGITKKDIEKVLGEDLPEKCKVVHGRQWAALLTPVFVS